MALHFYNSLSRQKERFVPMREGNVGMYVCGVTVYDQCHVGHARVMVVFDVVYRWLKASGYDVRYVRNFTDVDDKIIQRAQEAGKDICSLTQEMIAAFHRDMDALYCLRPGVEPCATEHMPQMIAMIERLIAKGFAYVASSGDVLYAVRKFDGYGALSGKNIDDLEAGSRVDVDASKHDPLDFVLWKQAKAGEPAWDSPWGAGRPGWHIECSAMSCHHLGDTFDIHGGGMDLKFPHHENEIAQAVAANDGHFARYWLHNGFVNIHAEKMSKSLGNFFTICQVLEQYPAEVLRMFILGTHYRSPLDFSDAAMNEAKTSLDRLYEVKKRVGTLSASDVALPDAFVSAMNDDINTAEALSVVFETAHAINKAADAGEDISVLWSEFSAMTNLLAIVQQDASAWFQGGGDVNVAKVEALIAERKQAREVKDWARSDAIRDELAAMHVVLEDGSSGTSWKLKS